MSSPDAADAGLEALKRWGAQREQEVAGLAIDVWSRVACRIERDADR